MLKRMFLIALVIAVSSAASAGVREDWQAVADAVALAGQEVAAVQIEEAVAALSDDELQRVYGEADLQKLADIFLDNGEALRSVDEIAARRAPTRPIPRPSAISDFARLESVSSGDPGPLPTLPLSPGLPDAWAIHLRPSVRSARIARMATIYSLQWTGSERPD